MSDLTRRNFIKALGMSGVAASYGCNSVLPQSQSPEISASVFPWDLADEGIENVLDNLQGRAGANSIYMCNLSQSISGALFGRHTPQSDWIEFGVLWRSDQSSPWRILPG